MSALLLHSVVGGLTLAFSVYWHVRIVPQNNDASPSLRSTLQAKPTSVAFTTAQVSVGIILSRFIPTAFYPCPLSLLPHVRLIISTALQTIGFTIANTCTIPHLSPFVRPSICTHRIPSNVCPLLVIIAISTATLFPSSQSVAQTDPHTVFDLTLPFALKLTLKLPTFIESQLPYLVLLIVTFAVTLGFPPLLLRLIEPPLPSLLVETASYVLGLCYAAIFVASHALNPTKVLASLYISTLTWDPSLWIFVFSSMLTMQILFDYFPPAFTDDHQQPTIDLEKLGRETLCTASPTQSTPCVRAYLGAVLVAVGFGLSGVSPVAALIFFGASPSNFECVTVVSTMIVFTVLSSVILDVVDQQTTETEIFTV